MPQTSWKVGQDTHHTFRKLIKIVGIHKQLLKETKEDLAETVGKVDFQKRLFVLGDQDLDFENYEIHGGFAFNAILKLFIYFIFRSKRRLFLNAVDQEIQATSMTMRKKPFESQARRNVPKNLLTSNYFCVCV